MTLRDAKTLSQLIKKNLDLGLNLDTVLEKFEIERKNSNFVFAMGVDFLHEFFKFNNNWFWFNLPISFSWHDGGICFFEVPSSSKR